MLSFKIFYDKIIDVINYKSNKVITIDYFDFDGTFILLDDLLIINWTNGITHYFVKCNDIYEHIKLSNFDFEYYKKFIDKSSNDIEQCYLHWLTYGRLFNIPFYDEKKFYINDYTNILRINHSELNIYKNNVVLYKLDECNDLFYKFNNNTYYIYKNICVDFKCNDHNNLYIYKYLDSYYTTYTKPINNYIIEFNNNNYEYYKISFEFSIEKISIPCNFDWIYYKNNTPLLNDDNCKSIYDAFNFYLEYGGNFIDETTILFDSEYDVIINHTTNEIDVEVEYFNIINNNLLEIKMPDNSGYYYKSNNIYKKINIIKNLNYKINDVYILSNLKSGGAVKYINDLKKKYKNIYIINEKSSLPKIKDNDLLMIQHLFDTNIEITDILELIETKNIKSMITVHDFYWFNNKILKHFDYSYEWHINYLKTDLIINHEIKKLFNRVNSIIMPSIFMYDEYSKYFNNSNFNLVYHNDFQLNFNNQLNLNIINNTINIGVFHEKNVVKGNEFIDYLTNKFKSFKNYQIKFFIIDENIPKYKNEYFLEHVLKYNINGLINLGIVGESYCYYLTNIINIGLPFFYNNFGSFKERIHIKKNHHFICFNNEKDINFDIDDKFNNFLDYIINNKNTNVDFIDILKNKSIEICYNEFYDNLLCK